MISCLNHQGLLYWLRHRSVWDIDSAPTSSFFNSPSSSTPVLPILLLLLPQWTACCFFSVTCCPSVFAHPSLMGSWSGFHILVMIYMNQERCLIWFGGGLKMDVRKIESGFKLQTEGSYEFLEQKILWSMPSQKERENPFADLIGEKGDLGFWQVISSKPLVGRAYNYLFCTRYN